MLGGAFAAVSGILFLISMFINRSYFEPLAYDSVVSYELRQLFAVLFLFGIGIFFLAAIRETLPAGWTVLLSFPVGVCLWAFVSLLLLLAGIPYTFFLTIFIIVIVLCILLAAGYKKGRLHISAGFIKESVPFLLFCLGLAFLAASGFQYSFVSYDSYFYFINYGHTLTIVKNFRDIVGENSFTLTNISQFLPLVHSYASFWGLDQAYQLQAFLACDVIAAFFYGLYQFAAEAFSASGSMAPAAQKKRALLFSALFTLLLASSTSFIVVSSWVLANMYCMVYIFFLFISSFFVSHFHNAHKEAMILISICFTALTLLRKDGIIFAAFFLICFCSIELFSKKQLALLFLPAVFAETVWLFYVRVVLSAKVAQATYSSIANNKNIFFVCCIITGSGLYLLFAHDILKWLERKIPALTEYIVLFAGILMFLAASVVLKDLNTIIDNIDFVIRNMFRYPSSWGISGFFFGVLLAFSFIRSLKYDYLHFLWSGYALLNLVSYCVVDSKWFWLNWDDSYNRVLLQIIPVFVFIMAVKILPLLQFYTPDRNSES